MILYEDKEILVCRKSSGIAVQSARLGEKDLVSILNNHLAEQAKLRETSLSKLLRAYSQHCFTKLFNDTP